MRPKIKEQGGPARYPIVDMARGFAIGLMMIYHFSWDLTFFGYADFRIFEDPLWLAFSWSIAAIILFVMGFSQILSRRRGLTAGSFVRRLTLIAGSAAMVSVATYLMDPGSFVFFGILHNIALTSALFLVLLRLGTMPLAFLAVLALAAPSLIAGPVFSESWLLWLGLHVAPPLAVDYVPLLPWLGITLAGVVAGRLTFRGGEGPSLFGYQPANPAACLLRLMGRHSLAIYLIHQPILFGAVYLAALGRA